MLSLASALSLRIFGVDVTPHALGAKPRDVKKAEEAAALKAAGGEEVVVEAAVVEVPTVEVPAVEVVGEKIVVE